ncbi:MAG: hypothetical protein RLZZ01_1838 [Actinomycetota bacterium]
MTGGLARDEFAALGLAGIGVPDAGTAWERIGCRVTDGAVDLANGSLLLGVDGLVVTGGSDTELEGIPIRSGAERQQVEQPNGALGIDHLVLLTSSIARTSGAVEECLGLPCRRVRDTGSVRQAFHRFADSGESRGCIVEVVEDTRVPDGIARLMGLVLVVADLDALARRLGPDVVSEPKAAVQPGRSIATVRRDVGLGTAVALMTP